MSLRPILRDALLCNAPQDEAAAGGYLGKEPTTYSSLILRRAVDPSRRIGSLVLALGLLSISACTSTSPASEIENEKQNYSRDYTGVWGVDGLCEYGGDFVFADSFIERAGEDICYIESINERMADIEVTAICWHEFKPVGSPTYRLRITREGWLIINDSDANAYHKCGLVPQELIDFYTANIDQ